VKDKLSLPMGVHGGRKATVALSSSGLAGRVLDVFWTHEPYNPRSRICFTSARKNRAAERTAMGQFGKKAERVCTIIPELDDGRACSNAQLAVILFDRERITAAAI
jgi:hypothetical protein